MGMGPHVLPPLDAVGVDGRLVASVVVVAQVERLEHASVDTHQPLGRAGAGVEVFRLGLALGFG